MRVLVTGAAGLIGFNTCKYYLGKGATVVGIDNLERSDLLGHDVSPQRRSFNWKLLHELGAQCVYGDVSHERMFAERKELFDGFDIIVHLAGQCGVPTSIANPRRDFEVNAIGTFNVLEYVRLSGKGRVVYASTNKTYPLHSGWALDSASSRWSWLHADWRDNGFPKDGEISHPDHLGGSRTPYGTSKYVGDLLMQEYHHTYGIPTACFRMSCIYGPNQMGFEEQGWATWFIIAAMKGLPLKIYGDGKQVRDMLYVEDVVKAYDAFATSNTVMHGVWNIGGGPGFTLSLNECMSMLETQLGVSIMRSYHDWRPSDQRIYTSDIRPLKDELGWSPSVTPEQGLIKVSEWVGKNLDLF
jgi:CDP-paratose 2-epimerase